MEIFGNVESLKDSIGRKYDSKIEDVENNAEKQMSEIDEELNKKLIELRTRMRAATESEAKKVYSIILGEQKMNAKREFEEKREDLIESVFKKAEEGAKKVAHNKDYINYVKKHKPKDKKLSVIGDGAFFKKHFSKVKIDSNIIGLRFESEGVIYDFSLNNAISSKKDVLRHEVSQILFS